ncbi:hypothetical protein [Streptomyces triculaminicus]|uniref:hypothetical protein n=1 Tax=Streptomyces triculaminicus TaxID=2816232 RepID=UPI0037BBCFF9
MATRKIELTAGKRESLTLDQLAAFIDDARRSGASGDEAVAATVTFGGKLRGVSIGVKQGPAARSETG